MNDVSGKITAIVIVAIAAATLFASIKAGCGYYLEVSRLYQNQMSSYVSQGYTPQEAECAVNGYSTEACHTLAILSGLKGLKK